MVISGSSLDRYVGIIPLKKFPMLEMNKICNRSALIQARGNYSLTATETLFCIRHFQVTTLPTVEPLTKPGLLG